MGRHREVPGGFTESVADFKGGEQSESEEVSNGGGHESLWLTLNEGAIKVSGGKFRESYKGGDTSIILYVGNQVTHKGQGSMRTNGYYISRGWRKK